jgi:hypothetical protein
MAAEKEAKRTWTSIQEEHRYSPMFAESPYATDEDGSEADRSGDDHTDRSHSDVK